MDYIRKSIDNIPKYVNIFDECKILIEQGVKIAILKAIDNNADYINKSGINGLLDIVNNDRKKLNDKIINDMDMKKKKHSAPFLSIRDYTENCRHRDKNSVEAIRKATKYYFHDDRKSIPIQNETYEILMKMEDYFNINNPLFENITEQQQKIIIGINEIINYVIKKFMGDKTMSVLNDFGYTSDEEVNDAMEIINNYNEDIDDDFDELLEDIAKGKLFHGEDISELSEMMNHGDLFSRIIKKEPVKIVEEKHVDFDEYNEENNAKRQEELEKTKEHVNEQTERINQNNKRVMSLFVNNDEDDDFSDILAELDLLIAKEKEDNYVSHAGLIKKLKEFFNSHKTPEKKSKKTKTIKKSGVKEVHDSIHEFEKRLDKLTKSL